MWDGEIGRKAYHGQCCGDCCNCKNLSHAKQGSVSLMARLKQDEAKDRLRLIKAELGIKGK